MISKFFGFHLDFLGFTASLICAVHCAAVPLVVAIGMLGGLAWLHDPIMEIGFFITSLSIGGITLVSGLKKKTLSPAVVTLFTIGFALIVNTLLSPHTHGIESLQAVIGGLSIAAAHFSHWLTLRKKTCETVA